MTDYIRKAVELADGFGYAEGNIALKDRQQYRVEADMTEPFILDALAAQLVRQMDSRVIWLEIQRGTTRLKAGNEITKEYGPDRTLNTIKAIVDSGVLE